MGFLTLGNFILGAPIETREHIENTIKFACSLPIDIANFTVFSYNAGSPLWEEAIRNKKITKEEKAVFATSDRHLGNLSFIELEEFVNVANIRFYLRLDYIISQIYLAFLRRNFSLINIGIKILKTLLKLEKK
jgi:anaerobic magnesium-protoporphyrin IX monomethyl ester cyclase